jgi:hypothetical protein
VPDFTLHAQFPTTLRAQFTTSGEVGSMVRSRSWRASSIAGGLQSPDTKGIGPCFRPTVARPEGVISPKNGPVPGLCSSPVFHRRPSRHRNARFSRKMNRCLE